MDKYYNYYQKIEILENKVSKIQSFDKINENKKDDRLEIRNVIKKDNLYYGNISIKSNEDNRSILECFNIELDNELSSKIKSNFYNWQRFIVDDSHNSIKESNNIKLERKESKGIIEKINNDLGIIVDKNTGYKVKFLVENKNLKKGDEVRYKYVLDTAYWIKIDKENNIKESKEIVKISKQNNIKNIKENINDFSKLRKFDNFKNSIIK